MYSCFCVVINILLHTLSHIILLAVKKEDEEIEGEGDARKKGEEEEDEDEEAVNDNVSTLIYSLTVICYCLEPKRFCYLCILPGKFLFQYIPRNLLFQYIDLL